MLHETVGKFVRLGLPCKLCPGWSSRRLGPLPATDIFAHVHVQHWWLPSPEQIRPSETMRALKEITLEQAILDYRSPTDYLLITIFGAPHVHMDGKLAVQPPGDGLHPTAVGWDAEAIRQVFIAYRIRPIKFVPNPFPYSLDAGSHHFVLWFSTPQLMKSDDEVNRDIWREIRRYLTETKQDAAERREEGVQTGGGGAAAGESAATLDLVDFAW